jgi:hypothetical protein
MSILAASISADEDIEDDKDDDAAAEKVAAVVDSRCVIQYKP